MSNLFVSDAFVVTPSPIVPIDSWRSVLHRPGYAIAQAYPTMSAGFTTVYERNELFVKVWT